MQDDVTEGASQEPSQDAISQDEATGNAPPPEMEEEATPAAQSGEEGAAIEEPSTGPSSAVAQTGEPGHERNLDLILDIPLQLSVELGRTSMLIRDLVHLGQGSIVELSKELGEPVEVLVNNKLIARGEVVVVEEKFGVRLTDIVSPSERIEKLRWQHFGGRNG